jgi:glycosyltransferase involved in cell wall biosynthesis
MVLVSVIMPSYNHEKFISKAIKSVLSQSFKDLELIVVQDEQNERIIKIVYSYMDSDARVVLKIFNKRLGVCNAFNTGLDIAKGKFVAFIGSDDVWLRNKLETQIEYLEKHPNSIVWSDAFVIDESDKYIGCKFSELYPSKKKSGYIFNELVLGNYISGQSMILKKELFGNIRFDSSYPVLNDYKVNLDLSFKHKFIFINRPLVLYRMHPGNLSSTAGKLWNSDSSRILNYIIETYSGFLSPEIKFELFLRLAASQFILHSFHGSIDALFNSCKFLKIRSIVALIRNIYRFLPNHCGDQRHWELEDLSNDIINRNG